MKRLVAILLATILLRPVSVSGQNGVPAEAESASRQEGVAAAPRDYSPYPAPDRGYVTDKGDILSPEQVDHLNAYLWQVEARTGVEIAVLIIQSTTDYPGTDRGSIETFSRALFDTWGVGNLPANNGVLLVIALNDRKARIELGAGYGNLRDSDAQRIMDHTILPRFKKGRYASGVVAGTEALGLEFAHVRSGVNWPLLSAGVAMVISILIAVSLFRNGKRGWGWVAVGGGIVGFLYLFEALDRLNNIQIGDYGTFGGDGGGFGGGFGGGSSGGGGASGGW